jgi:hypothetical protein
MKLLIHGKPGPTASGPPREALAAKVEQVKGKWYVFQVDDAADKTC